MHTINTMAKLDGCNPTVTDDTDLTSDIPQVDVVVLLLTCNTQLSLIITFNVEYMSTFITHSTTTQYIHRASTTLLITSVDSIHKQLLIYKHTDHKQHNTLVNSQ